MQGHVSGRRGYGEKIRSVGLSFFYFQEIHRCYMVTILPIGLSIIEQHLVTFLDKFTAVLMEVIKIQNYKDNILQVI